MRRWSVGQTTTTRSITRRASSRAANASAKVVFPAPGVAVSRKSLGDCSSYCGEGGLLPGSERSTGGLRARGLRSRCTPHDGTHYAVRGEQHAQPGASRAPPSKATYIGVRRAAADLRDNVKVEADVAILMPVPDRHVAPRRPGDPSRLVSVGGWVHRHRRRFVIERPTLLHVVAHGVAVAPGHQLVAPQLLRSQALDLLDAAVRRGELAEDVAQHRHEAMPAGRCGSSENASPVGSVADRAGARPGVDRGRGEPGAGPTPGRRLRQRRPGGPDAGGGHRSRRHAGAAVRDRRTMIMFSRPGSSTQPGPLTSPDAGQVGGVDDPVGVSLLGQEPLAVRGVIGVERVPG